MNRRCRKFWSLVLSASVLAPGCQPQQPFYCREDGDLSHYLDVATRDRVSRRRTSRRSTKCNNTLPPLTLKNTDNYEMWDLSLEEAVQITLCNSQVMRQLGGRVASTAPETISRTLISPVAVDDDVRSGLGRNDDRPLGRLAVPRLRPGSGAERVRRAARCQRVLGKEPTGRRTGSTSAVGSLSPPIFAAGPGQRSPPASPRRRPTVRTFGIRNNTNYDRQQHSVAVPATSIASRFRSAWHDELRSDVHPSVVARRRRAIQPHRRSADLRSVRGRLRQPDRRRDDRPHSHRPDAGRFRRRRRAT